ncbi:hypothetical protein FRC0457_00477 [Corynebacterium diphtheriae]|nr:hypothetical protein FRC0457_00477 [Corynebacterium diphtheriae]
MRKAYEGKRRATGLPHQITVAELLRREGRK